MPHSNNNQHLTFSRLGRVMHLCFSNPDHNWSDNGLLPTQCQAIVWTNAGCQAYCRLDLWKQFSVKFEWITQFSYNKMNLNMSSVKWRQFCLGLSMYLYLYLYLMDCICIWSDFCQCICICIWNSEKNVFVFVFVFDNTYLTPALVTIEYRVARTLNRNFAPCCRCNHYTCALLPDSRWPLWRHAWND